VDALKKSRAAEIASRAREHVLAVKEQRKDDCSDEATLDSISMIFPQLTSRDNLACAIDLATRLNNRVMPRHYFNLLWEAHTIKRAVDLGGLDQFIREAVGRMLDTLEALPGDWWDCWTEAEHGN